MTIVEEMNRAMLATTREGYRPTALVIGVDDMAELRGLRLVYAATVLDSAMVAEPVTFQGMPVLVGFWRSGVRTLVDGASLPSTTLPEGPGS